MSIRQSETYDMKEMVGMKVSEQLDKAADLIQLHGWGQGVSTWTDNGVGLCLEGGIAAAAGAPIHAFREGMMPDLDRLYRCPAYKAVKEYLVGRSDFWAPLYVWNDRKGRTAEEVIEVLRAAAAVERTKEAIPAEVAS